jgi:hypothetical protein
MSISSKYLDTASHASEHYTPGLLLLDLFFTTHFVVRQRVR